MGEVGTPNPHVPHIKWELSGARQGLWFRTSCVQLWQIYLWSSGMYQKIPQAQENDLTYFADKRPTDSPQTAMQSGWLSSALWWRAPSPAFRYPARHTTAKAPPEWDQGIWCFEQLPFALFMGSPCHWPMTIALDYLAKSQPAHQVWWLEPPIHSWDTPGCTPRCTMPLGGVTPREDNMSKGDPWMWTQLIASGAMERA